jgi:hypothetical protein
MPENKYAGNDNFKKPKQLFIDKLKAASDTELFQICSDKIWLSAYADNNSRSDFHWQCDACYDECVARAKPEIYGNAHKKLTKEL